MSQPWALGDLLSPHAGGRGRDPKRHPVHLRRQPSPGAEETSFLLVGGAFQKRKQKPSWKWKAEDDAEHPWLKHCAEEMIIWILFMHKKTQEYM
ncbi:uncharacterized protein LOC106557569 isoform X2 [Canis lupus familiaris]|uniref:uncharacterized protein LOC106557569 isoform X2 n=1 Tax=Canis lupus familiaris TaxID=9615 RepID=UPI0018F7D690|nr:uncharacterized protein LOC106557569 isoform X2 [Canis lupus familiaris]